MLQPWLNVCCQIFSHTGRWRLPVLGLMWRLATSQVKSGCSTISNLPATAKPNLDHRLNESTQSGNCSIYSRPQASLSLNCLAPSTVRHSSKARRDCWSKHDPRNNTKDDPRNRTTFRAFSWFPLPLGEGSYTCLTAS